MSHYYPIDIACNLGSVPLKEKRNEDLMSDVCFHFFI